MSTFRSAWNLVSVELMTGVWEPYWGFVRKFLDQEIRLFKNSEIFIELRGPHLSWTYSQHGGTRFSFLLERHIS